MKKSTFPAQQNSATQERSSTNGNAKREPFPIVGIGASAGGLEAFRNVLAHLPEKTGMAYVFVQHLDPHHESTLREILSRATGIPVREIADGTLVERDHIYVIPANKELTIKEGTLHLRPRSSGRNQHRPVDVFFRSLAEDCGDRAIGVILSGTASDGTAGCQAIKAAGGITFAQHGLSARYDGMPRSAAESGSVDFVLPPENIAEELVRIGAHTYVRKPAKLAQDPIDAEQEAERERILEILRKNKSVDFAEYKQRTIQRRIERRMILNRVEKLADYRRLVEENPAEMEELYRDILIHMTGFFRDAKAFATLREKIFPEILERHRQDRAPIRIWVPGCSTGEEAYSMAIAITEYIWDESTKSAQPAGLMPIQIFATDVSDDALNRARAGVYPESALTDVSPNTLQRFFVKLDGGYQVGKFIRDICVFARQNIVRDPPFSRLDLISCRNVLIYLGPELQKRAVSALHYGLNPRGYLQLGRAENLAVFADHFELVDRESKIYQKKANAARLITYFTGVFSHETGNRGRSHRPTTAYSIDRELDHVLAGRFAPPSMVVNANMEVVQLRGKTGAYLQLPSGRPTFNLTKLAREGLAVDLQAALNKALQMNVAVKREGVTLRSGRDSREINLEVIPLPTEPDKEKLFAVVFQERAQEAPARLKGKRRQGKTSRKEAALVQENQRLLREVQELRKELDLAVEDHEATAEEFRTANEEVLSANEELQSANEELETAKEELQSNNEELMTLNDEQQARNTELLTTNNDLTNLLGNVNIPVVMVGDDLRIRRFTPPAQKLLNLAPTDIGRRLIDIRANVDVDDLETMVRTTMQGFATQERKVRDSSGAWHLMRIRPYKTWDQRIDGAVISFQDIDTLKRKLENTSVFADETAEKEVVRGTGD